MTFEYVVVVVAVVLFLLGVLREYIDIHLNSTQTPILISYAVWRVDLLLMVSFS